MQIVRRTAALAAIAVLPVACSDQPIEPVLDTPLFAAQAGLEVNTGTRHLVLFHTPGVADGFEASVIREGGRVVFAHPSGIAVVDGLADATARRLTRLRGVASIVPDAAFELDEAAGSGILRPVSDVVEGAAAPATALLFPLQWNMMAIHADAAWAAGRVGSSDVTLAILDSGIDYLYPDLAGRVDLSRSVSFVEADDALVALYFPSRHPVADLRWHGTHVATAAVSNAQFFAGVTSGTTLIGIKVCNVEGSCSFSSVIMGVLHAADVGADVANLSLGGYFAKAGAGRLVGYINRVFTYANSVGMTVVVAAGNDALDLDHDGNGFEAYCSAPNVICVAATGPTAAQSSTGPWTDIDAAADYTNFGRSAIAVAAPGGNVGGAVPGPCSQTSLVFPQCQTGLYLLSAVGTSMAAAHVSGLATLAVEDVGRKPSLVRAVVQQTADDLGQPGADPYYGKGRINVGAVVAR
jgi:subtilisin family serine protease